MTTQDKPQAWRWGYAMAKDGDGRSRCPFKGTQSERRKLWLIGWRRFHTLRKLRRVAWRYQP